VIRSPVIHVYMLNLPCLMC